MKHLWILVLLTGCASWTDTHRQLAITGLMVVDAYQTTKIQHRDDLTEGAWFANKVLGDNPKTSDTYQFFATLALSSWLISMTLPENIRPYYQWLIILDESRAVVRNCNNGLC